MKTIKDLKEVYRFNCLDDYVQNSIKFNYPKIEFQINNVAWINSKGVLVKKERDFIYADRYDFYPIVGLEIN